jgi:hypothetical protein
MVKCTSGDSSPAAVASSASRFRQSGRRPKKSATKIMKLDDDMPLDQQVSKPGKSQHTPMMHGRVLE